MEEEWKKAVSEIDETRAASVQALKRAGVEAAEVLRKAGAEVQRGVEGKAKEARYVSNAAQDFALEFQKQVEGKAKEIEAATHLALSLKKQMARQARWILGLLIFALLLVGWAVYERYSVRREVDQAAVHLRRLLVDHQVIEADIERLSDLRERVPVVFWPQETGEVWVIAPPGRTLVEVPSQRDERVFRVADQ